MYRGIDDEIAQRAVEREPACAHLDRPCRVDSDIESLIAELRRDGGDQLVELEEFGGRFSRRLAHEENGAVRDALKLIEIGEPARPLFLVPRQTPL